MQRLLSIVLMAAIPIGALQWMSVRQEQQEDREQVSIMALSIAQRAAAEQRRITQGARQLLTALAQMPAVKQRDEAACALILRRLHSQFEIYTVIGVSDLAGRIWCSSTQPGTDVSDRPFFREALTARKFTTGGYVVGRASGRRTLNFNLPVKDQGGQLSGLLVAGLDLDRLAADLGEEKLPEDSNVAIFGPDKRLLVNLPGSTALGTLLPQRFAPAFGDRSVGVQETSWLDGSDRIVAFIPPALEEDMPFFIMVGINRADALADVEAGAHQALMVLMAVLAAALLAAWWFATRSIRVPVQRLAGTVRAWRGGDTAVRAGRLTSGSELNDLAQAFDEMAEAVEERERLLHDALESTTDNVAALAPDWTITYLNGRSRARIEGAEVLGRTLWDAFPDLSGTPVGRALRMAMADRRPANVAFAHEGLGGHFEMNAYPARSGGLTLFSRDVTEEHRAHEELRRMALTDPLTGLANRPHAMDLAKEKAAQGLLSAVLLLDLDNFKDVNDSLGHLAGDEMLQEVAQRLAACLGESGVLARLGGDEFVAMLFDMTASRSVEIANALLKVLEAEPFLVRGRLQQISCSGGLVMLNGGAGAGAGAGAGVDVNVEEMLADADIALYRAKDAGGGTCHLYTTADRDAYEARRLLEEEIAEAARTGQFELYYQPQVRLEDGALVGAEALLRWRHPRRGLLEPAAFLDVLEVSRHAVPVGTWIIGEACRQAARWRRVGMKLRVSVNLFAPQLRSGDLPGIIRDALAHAKLPPDCLELELTENIALAVEADVTGTLLALRQLGVGLAYDDFGTGFASLTTLKNMPVTRLKIDRSFVSQLPDNEQDKAIVQAVLALAENLKLEVVAEGVETAQQEQYLRLSGCQEAQGYRYARPMSAQDFSAHILKEQHWRATIDR